MKILMVLLMMTGVYAAHNALEVPGALNLHARTSARLLYSTTEECHREIKRRGLPVVAWKNVAPAQEDVVWVAAHVRKVRGRTEFVGELYARPMYLTSLVESFFESPGIAMCPLKFDTLPSSWLNKYTQVVYTVCGHDPSAGISMSEEHSRLCTGISVFNVCEDDEPARLCYVYGATRIFETVSQLSTDKTLIKPVWAASYRKHVNQFCRTGGASSSGALLYVAGYFIAILIWLMLNALQPLALCFVGCLLVCILTPHGKIHQMGKSSGGLCGNRHRGGG